MHTLAAVFMISGIPLHLAVLPSPSFFLLHIIQLIHRITAKLSQCATAVVITEINSRATAIRHQVKKATLGHWGLFCRETTEIWSPLQFVRPWILVRTPPTIGSIIVYFAVKNHNPWVSFMFKNRSPETPSILKVFLYSRMIKHC